MTTGGGVEMNRWLIVITSVVIGATVVFMMVFRPTTEGIQSLQYWLQSFGPWAAVVSAALIIGQAIVAPIPANFIVITNGLVFGTVWGALLSWGSTLAGASLCFFVSKLFGRPIAFKLVGPALTRAEKFFHRYGGRAVFVVRIMPFVPFDAISYAAGLVGVPFSRFFLATAVGTIPSMLLYSYLGSIAFKGFAWLLLGIAAGVLVLVVMASRHIDKIQPPGAPRRSNPKHRGAESASA